MKDRQYQSFKPHSKDSRDHHRERSSDWERSSDNQHELSGEIVVSDLQVIAVVNCTVIVKHKHSYPVVVYSFSQ